MSYEKLYAQYSDTQDNSDKAEKPNIPPVEIITKWVPEVRRVIGSAALQRLERERRMAASNHRFIRSELEIMKAPLPLVGDAVVRLLQSEFPYLRPQSNDTFEGLSAMQQDTIWAAEEILYGSRKEPLSDGKPRPGLIDLSHHDRAVISILALAGAQEASVQTLEGVHPVVVAHTDIKDDGKVRLSVRPAQEVKPNRELQVLHPYDGRRRHVDLSSLDAHRNTAYVQGFNYAVDILAPQGSDATHTPETPQPYRRRHGRPEVVSPPWPVAPEDFVPSTTPEGEFDASALQPIDPESVQRALQQLEDLANQQRATKIDEHSVPGLSEKSGEFNLTSFPDSFDEPVEPFAFKKSRFNWLTKWFRSRGGRRNFSGERLSEADMYGKGIEPPSNSHMSIEQMKAELTQLAERGEADKTKLFHEKGDSLSDLKAAIAHFLAETTTGSVAKKHQIVAKNPDQLAKGIYAGLQKCVNSKRRSDYTEDAVEYAHVALETITLLKTQWGKRGMRAVLRDILQINEWSPIKVMVGGEVKEIRLTPTSRHRTKSKLRLTVQQLVVPEVDWDQELRQENAALKKV